MPFGGPIDTLPFCGILGAKSPNFGGPEIGNPIIKKIANNSKTVLDSETLTVDHLYEIRVGLSESAVILVTMATGFGKMLHRSPPKCRKRLTTRKWCELWQKFVLNTNSKPWVRF